ncbi:MAG: aminotransferase class I/II-fold pyridoxal phosphate-dependent enzyme [Prevotella sp.]|nr:aminotransferase class I/II-fold pyridoxal phosphate-dependent enzyme [Prevotella sp.]
MIKGHGDDAYQYPDIRMNFSSNIPQHVDLSALKQHLATRLDLIANYPEPEALSLERLIASQHGISEECVIVTSGATEAIYLTAQTFRMSHHFAAPTFSEYEDAVRMYRSYAKKTQALWLCNPNNPTGEVLPWQTVYERMSHYDLVVIDQSYEGYTEVPLLTPREAAAAGNVVQIHSLTKTYGVPGLRIGYIVAARRLAQQLRRQMRPWAVNALAIEAGLFLIAHATPIRPDLAEAQRLSAALNAIDGISVLPTQTNFMLCTISGHTATQLKEHLVRQHGMLIRDASNFRGLTPHHFRVAAQLPIENDALVSAINHYLHA